MFHACSSVRSPARRSYPSGRKEPVGWTDEVTLASPARVWFPAWNQTLPCARTYLALFMRPVGPCTAYVMVPMEHEKPTRTPPCPRRVRRMVAPAPPWGPSEWDSVASMVGSYFLRGPRLGPDGGGMTLPPFLLDHSAIDGSGHFAVAPVSVGDALAQLVALEATAGVLEA